MADRKSTTQQTVEYERGVSGEDNFAPAFDYESDMLAESKREQGYRGEAKRAKTPLYRDYYKKRADEAHQEMQRKAESGMAARYAKAHPRKRTEKRD